MTSLSTSCTVYSTKCPLVWCSRYLRRVLIDGVDARLNEIIAKIGGSHKCDGGGVGVMPDGVDLMTEVLRTVPLPSVVDVVNGRSSRLLGSEFPWPRRSPSRLALSWFASTAGGTLLQVGRYVENQKLVA